MLLADLPNPAQRTTRYFYGGESQWQVCEEQDGSGDTVATYVYGRYIDEVLQMQRCESTPSCTSPGGTGVSPVDYYYHTDDLYNVMAVTDDAGNVVERYEYDDYGRPTFMNANGDVLAQPPGNREPSWIANPYLFTGRRYDAETAWYHYRTRYLDPQSGRFTTRDIIGIWGDPWELGNGYAFVRSNPVAWFDPMGLSGICEILREQRDALEDDLKWNPKAAACYLSCALNGGRRPPFTGGPDKISPFTMCKVEDEPFYFDKCVQDCLKKYFDSEMEVAGETDPEEGKITLNKNVLKKWPFIITFVTMRHELDHRKMVEARQSHGGANNAGGGGQTSGGGSNSFSFGLEEVLIRFNDQDFAMNLVAKIRYLESLLGCGS
jgi:RHS repeat-associated protein